LPRKVKPQRIRLEASSICQLKCPSCPRVSGAIFSIIGNGFLRIGDFERLLDGNPWITEIELSNYGEIFLNPDFVEIIRRAFERDVALTADNGVNLNSVSNDILEALVKYGFRSMVCSIDGASPETYKQYRINGDFRRVIKNIERINLLKKEYKSKHPRLGWQFVVFGHNEHEIPIARKLAGELSMEFRLKLSWDMNFSPVQDSEFVRKQVGVASRDEYIRRYGADYMQEICHQLWEQPQINWDGRILGCCRNFWGDFGGNAFSDGLLEGLNSEKITYAREMLTGKKAAREDIPCTTCSIYLHMEASGKWLNRSLLYRALRFANRKLGLHRYREQIIRAYHFRSLGDWGV